VSSETPAAHLARLKVTYPSQDAMAGSRTLTVEAGLPEMQGRKDFYGLIAGELGGAGMLAANLSGMVTAPALMDRPTTDFGRQFVRFISPPALADHPAEAW
jgi:hypothetical protein